MACDAALITALIASVWDSGAIGTGGDFGRRTFSPSPSGSAPCVTLFAALMQNRYTDVSNQTPTIAVPWTTIQAAIGNGHHVISGTAYLVDDTPPDIEYNWGYPSSGNQSAARALAFKIPTEATAPVQYAQGKDSGGVTLGATPTEGNLLLIVHSMGPGAPPGEPTVGGASMGYALIAEGETGDGDGGLSVWAKCAGASEPALQINGLVADHMVSVSEWAITTAPTVVGLWVDWGADGYGVEDLIPVDDVESFEWHRGAASDSAGAPPAGSAVAIVANHTGRYSPDNAASDLYGLLLPGRPAWCGVMRATGKLHDDGTGNVRGVFGGYVRKVTPIAWSEAAGKPVAIIEFDDRLGRSRNRPVTIGEELGQSQGEFRGLALDGLEIPSGQRVLEPEWNRLVLSGASEADGFALLDELNSATGSRHAIEPEDDRESGWSYHLANRRHKLDAAADETIDAADVEQATGFDVGYDAIVNRQAVRLSPLAVAGYRRDVYEAETPISVPAGVTVTVLATFDDFVAEPEIEYAASGAVTVTMTPFARAAKIELDAAGDVTLSLLRITGRSVVRGMDVVVTEREELAAASVAAYDLRAAAEISSDLVGGLAMATGLANAVVWRGRDPRRRLTIERVNIPAALDRQMYDVVELTLPRLYLEDRRFEVISVDGSLTRTGVVSVIHQLLETPNPAPLDLFVLGQSLLGGPDVLAI